jgi:TerC family integral membrane protein
VDVSLGMWLGTVGLVLVLLTLDFVVGRNPHDVSMKEATLWSVFYVGIALAFGVLVWTQAGADYGTQYYAAWLVEKSLSVDNLFIFVIIFAKFAVPSELQQRALLIGVALALVLRAIFIAVGAAALELFAFTFVIFGLFLIWTAVQLFRHRDEDADLDDNAVLRVARRRLTITDQYHGNKLRITQDDVRAWTPMALVLVAIGSTDLLFALDSIPATFGVTAEPFLVFAANAFALLGLRALFFVLHNLLDKLVYLAIGLSVILGFIGIKLILTFVHEVVPEVPKVPTAVSLVFIVLTLTVTTVASLLKARRDPTAHAHSGALHGHRATDGSTHDESTGDRPTAAS